MCFMGITTISIALSFQIQIKRVEYGRFIYTCLLILLKKKLLILGCNHYCNPHMRARCARMRSIFSLLVEKVKRKI